MSAIKKSIGTWGRKVMSQINTQNGNDDPQVITGGAIVPEAASASNSKQPNTLLNPQSAAANMFGPPTAASSTTAVGSQPLAGVVGTFCDGNCNCQECFRRINKAMGPNSFYAPALVYNFGSANNGGSTSNRRVANTGGSSADNEIQSVSQVAINGSTDVNHEQRQESWAGRRKVINRISNRLSRAFRRSSEAESEDIPPPNSVHANVIDATLAPSNRISNSQPPVLPPTYTSQTTTLAPQAGISQHASNIAGYTSPTATQNSQALANGQMNEGASAKPQQIIPWDHGNPHSQGVAPLGPRATNLVRHPASIHYILLLIVTLIIAANPPTIPAHDSFPDSTRPRKAAKIVHDGGQTNIDFVVASTITEETTSEHATNTTNIGGTEAAPIQLDADSSSNDKVTARVVATSVDASEDAGRNCGVPT